MPIIPLLALLAVAGSTCLDAAETTTPQRFERIGWLSETNGAIDCALRLRFTGLVVGLNDTRISNFCNQARAAGLDVYCWLGLSGGGTNSRQVITLADNDALARIRASKDPYADGYQCGGEPLTNRLDVLGYSPPCFHRQDVMAATRAEIKRVIETFPDVTGIALDGIGYQNYRFCDCPVSRSELAAYRLKNPGLSDEKALTQFSLDTLVACYNDLADYARSLRPAIKTTCHVYPTFLPEPLYGNRLNLDSVQQTCAWFFKPYWTDERIALYARAVVRESRRYFPHQQGIPFIGIDEKKTPERVQQELRRIFSADDARSLGTFIFSVVAKDPAMEKAFAEVFKEFGIIPCSQSN